MAEFKKGDRVKVEFEGTFIDRTYGGRLAIVEIDYQREADAVVRPEHIKRIGAKVKPNQVWQRDSERFYVRGGSFDYEDPEYVSRKSHATAGVDLISFATNRRAFHLPPGGGSLEDEGFELILDIEESE